jgi:hypothetical protein
MENQQAQSLTVQDLIFVKNLLEVVTKRGAFSAEELTTVGTFYDKLAGFLSATEVQAQAAGEAQAEANAQQTPEADAEATAAGLGE